MNPKRIVIFSGGNLSLTYLEELQSDDFLIGADKGALFLIENNLRPHIAVGDFDSIDPGKLAVIEQHSDKVISCDPVNKDLTDSELAFDIALQHNPGQILLIGVTGTRLDHTLANIQMMNRALQHNISCAILDENNYITLTGGKAQVHERGYTYVSLLPMTPEVTGITLQGFQYPLTNYTLKMGQSRGISNILQEESGTITIESGLLLIIQSKD